MKKVARDYLYYFNYVDHPTEADPSTTFFTYDKETQHDENKLAKNWNGFKHNNAEALQRVLNVDQGKANFAFNENFPAPLAMSTIGDVA